MNWTQDYENILESLRLNSVYMSRSHKKKYFAFKRMSNWFRVPTIVLSAFASVIAVGSEPYLKQQNISGITCLVSDDRWDTQFN
jgi:K+ transporter